MFLIKWFIVFIFIKYGKKTMRFIDQKYNEKFNIKFFTKENCIKTFIASAIILFGIFQTLLTSNSGTVIIFCGLAIVCNQVYNLYKMTNIKYTIIGIIIYSLLTLIFIYLGFFILFIFLLMAGLYDYKKEKIYIYNNYPPL